MFNSLYEDSFVFQVYALVSLFMILASVASMCASSVLVEEDDYVRAFEYTFCAWFTLEFVARFAFCPDKIAFFKEIMTWVDLISLLPFYGKMILGNDTLDFLRAVRLIRVFRALKAFAFTSGLQIIVQSLKASFRELILLVIILLIPVVVFSSIVYEIENNAPNQPYFKNIPQAFWWAVITMTTVGYGDMVPKTIWGRIIGGICAIFGVLIVALPVSVIGNNFSTYYTHAQARLSLPKKKRRLICAANLRLNFVKDQSASSNASLRHNEGQEGVTTDASRESSAKKFRRYHRRSRNTLFAHGDVYIGPNRLERNKIKRGDTCNEENEIENEQENETGSETKSECTTTKKTISSGDMDRKSEMTVNLSSADGSGELPTITSLPRNFTLINSTHESEEIIEEDTRPASVLSERLNGVNKKRNRSLAVSASRRKKSNSSLSKSWVERKREHSLVEKSRPQSSRSLKTRVAPADARGSYQNHVDGSLSPSRSYRSVPSFKLDMENTRLDRAALANMAEQESKKTTNNSILMEAFQRTGKTSDGDIANGYTA